MNENTRFKNTNFNAVFGELRKVHTVRRSFSDKFLAPGALFFLVVLGVITYVAADDWLTLPCCVILPVLMFALASWQIFSTRGDTLRIYENGFTYESGKKLQACLWSEIKECRPRGRNEREMKELNDGTPPLGAVEKQNGETINFDSDVPGTSEITTRFDARNF